MTGLEGVTTRTGTDSLGRPATVLSYARAEAKQDAVYADPDTGPMLDGDFVLGTGNTLGDPPSTLSQALYAAIGPVDSGTAANAPAP